MKSAPEQGSGDGIATASSARDSRSTHARLLGFIVASIGVAAFGSAAANPNIGSGCDPAPPDVPATAASSTIDGPLRSTFDIINHVVDSCPCESEVPAAVRERITRLRGAIAKSHQQPWVGEYSVRFGPFVGMRVLLAPDGEFVMREDGDAGYMAENHGRATIGRDGIFRFRFASPKAAGYGGAFFERLAFIRWGDRRYLIPPKSFALFADEINEGREPVVVGTGDFLLMEGDAGRHVAGLPPLPASALGHLRRDTASTSTAFTPDAVNRRIDEQLARERAVACAPSDSLPPVQSPSGANR